MQSRGLYIQSQGLYIRTIPGTVYRQLLSIIAIHGSLANLLDCVVSPIQTSEVGCKLDKFI